jgi:hypothetical protein
MDQPYQYLPLLRKEKENGKVNAHQFFRGQSIPAGEWENTTLWTIAYDFRKAISYFAFQGVTYLFLNALQVPNAEIVIRNWWSVYGTLVDIGCLGLLLCLTRREGIKITDLISFDRKKLKVDILLGLGIPVFNTDSICSFCLCLSRLPCNASTLRCAVLRRLSLAIG